MDKKQALYREHEGECIEAQERAHCLISYVYFRTAHPEGPKVITMLYSALEQFHRVLKRLENLEMFIHEPCLNFNSSRTPTISWHRAPIAVFAGDGHEDRDALWLAMIFQALGSAGSINPKLRSLRLYISGSMFWSAEPLG